MIEAYEEKQQELRTLKRGKSKKSTKGTKKRRRQQDQAAEDEEVCKHLHLPNPAPPLCPPGPPLHPLPL